MTDITARLSAALSDRYSIERELGEGGMATVFLAEDIKHKRKVAIKVLKPELAAVLGAERFVQEITTTAALQHPHILPLFDSGEADGFLWYAMPFIDGETLRDKLNRETQFGIDEAIRITTEVAEALHYAHTQGVVHRDIKPENILLANGRPMVADFGIALAVSAAAGGRMTETGLSLGTPHYMSPEQATADKEIGPRSDVYSLASVLYEMLTGEPPHMGNSAQQVIMKIIAEESAPVTELRKSVPSNVSAAVAKALEKLPADRFESAAAFKDALGNPAFTTMSAAAMAAAPTTVRGWLRSPLSWVAVAVAATALGVAVLGSGSDDSRMTTDSALRFSFSDQPGEELGQDVAVSAQGDFVVYSATRNGLSRLYRRDLGDPTPRPIERTAGARFPAISPDGRWLAYVGPDKNVYKTSLSGGRPLLVDSFAQPPLGISWSEGHGLVYGMLAYSDVSGLSISADTAGSLARPLTTIDSSGEFNMHHFPFVPGAGDLALFENMAGGRLGIASLEDGSWEVLDLQIWRVVGWAEGVLVYTNPDGGLSAVALDLERRELLSDPLVIAYAPGNIRNAAMSGNGTLAMVIQPSSFRIESVDETGVGVPLFPDTITSVGPRYSPDGTKAAFTVTGSGPGAIWLHDFTTGIRSTFDAPRRSSLDWSADGTHLLMGGFRRLHRGAVNGSDSVEQIYELPDRMRAATFSLSPDGQNLVLGTDLIGGMDIKWVDLNGDRTPQELVQNEANEAAPRFSPDGRWVAYSSDRSQTNQIYVERFPTTGARYQLTQSGGYQPVWSRDGNRVYYRVGNALEAVDLDIADDFSSLAVTGTTRLFEGAFSGVHSTRRATYDVAPDGKHFLMARAIEGQRSEIVVWVNWLAEVKALLGQD